MINEEKLSKYIGSKIREYRLKKKLNQKELGKRIGVSHNTVSDYENGKISLGQDMLFVLADEFGVSIDDFFPARKKSINNLEEIISNEDFDVTDIEFLRHLIEKTKSLSGNDRDRFMQNIRLAIEFFDKADK